MRSGGGSSTHIGMSIGEDWWTFLSTYDNGHSPILDISCGSTTVAFSLAGRRADDSALEFARELASQAAKFAADVERLHALANDGQAPEDEAAGEGEAA